MNTNTPPKASWEPHGSGSNLILHRDVVLGTVMARFGFRAVVLARAYPDRFSTQAEAERFAVETLRGILRDVEERLP